MNLIPTTDLAEFIRLPSEMQTDIQAWIKELSAVSKPIQTSLENIAARMGVSYQTARRKYDAWRKKRHWSALKNLAKVPESGGVSSEFVESYWKKLVEQNGRKCLPAYKQFVREFKAGYPIPGIEPGLSRK